MTMSPTAAHHESAGPSRRVPGDRVRGASRPGTMSSVPAAGTGVDRLTCRGTDTVSHLATGADDVGTRGPVRTSVTGAVGARGPVGSAPPVRPVAAPVPGLLGERLP